ncbi:RNA pyrophosphohydrolase [Lichenihabitans sp. PAMC28606]|uniref:RNA pyrophosphohydrolase n=1 Tax=Lichenihabitans sp. PAMC28606 TaxID=2880932 RepID=UPI001D0B7D23|nr:RNA pyrophosphohydrolase [Lichenihabitans sp. PAMC28606]UDL94784.1 RNA pyrophosphohydrolase [Lichenihabitans sp. PAMC28606]
MSPQPDLPYRPNAGIALFNRAGLVFAGRSRGDGPETVRGDFEWQMPQGGIDPGEDLVAAARRELMEETSIGDADFLAATDEWWPYDFPAYDGPWHHLCAFRGQTQRWVAFRFTGDESRIDVLDPIGGVRPEFFDWAWLPLASLPAKVMPHKRASYERVVAAFGRFAVPV